ncbi:MAG: glutamine--fructose-6-phosphate transaminase (isomerizing) [Pseudomonadota bacterium]
MCGIVGAIADRQVTPILIEGLRRLEYRGYDSAGFAILADTTGALTRVRRAGKVQALAEAVETTNALGRLGIAHTRWATHGSPVESNAHPHISNEHLAVVHNGIIENYETLKETLIKKGYSFTSETDTEVIAHLIHLELTKDQDLLAAVRRTLTQLHGAFAIGVISAEHPDRLIASRKGSPLVIGCGIGENFIASDQLALLPVTNRFIFLEEGDLVELHRTSLQIYNQKGEKITRPFHELDITQDQIDKGSYRHFMLKEIFEQPDAIRRTLEGRLSENHVLEQAFGPKAKDLLDKVKSIQMIACGTSYHAGCVARYWFESLAGISCQVEIASEFRYRKSIIQPGTLFVSISQSGETADTLAALRDGGDKGYVGALTICNVPTSSLVRESDLAIMTHAGPEIGVASTKAFVTQLTALFMLVLSLARRNNPTLNTEHYVKELHRLPIICHQALQLDAEIAALAADFGDKRHALFLGRGLHYPIAMEGALKLKEISYIHAEAYAAGELKHGPLALVDEHMPVVAVAPSDDLLEKLKSNLQEVRARSGMLYLFADEKSGIQPMPGVKVIYLPSIIDVLAPILYTIPLQLLSYHVAVIKGTDVDQPRNLAKSVTVE